MPFEAISPASVQLLPSIYTQRAELNTRYVTSLRDESLLQNHNLEAGLTQGIFRATDHGAPGKGDDWHWGWESPTCQVRGHFLGHWLSAVARLYANTGDGRFKARADHIVSELGRCQQENGGEWAGSIPREYLEWIARGKRVWAPHYTLHKTLMGLCDAVRWTGNEQALDILTSWADWFYRWTGQFSRQEYDDILDVETGGMMEAWADLYGFTGSEQHLDLMRRYERRRLFDRLLAEEDPLSNRHANTTVPEAHGAARAYEVTGEERWRQVAEAYWRCAVTERGTFCTGGQTSGEIWTPPFAFAARLGRRNQEHCVVYNMIRLADYLFRWSGDPAYADYIERNTYNGILAQQHPDTGMIAYFLPLAPGSQKLWGTPTNDFWCCHGSLVQAHTRHNDYVYYAGDRGLAVCQHVPSELSWEYDGVGVSLRQTFDPEVCDSRVHHPDGAAHRPRRSVVDLAVRCEEPVAFALNLRLPWWVAGEPTVLVNGERQPMAGAAGGFHIVERTWQDDTVRLELPRALSICPLPDDPDTVAFMDGPVVLAGLCDEERLLVGDPDALDALLAPDNEREFAVWHGGWRARDQARGLRFVPLHEVRDERYTVYFPVQPCEAGGR